MKVEIFIDEVTDDIGSGYVLLFSPKDVFINDIIGTTFFESKGKGINHREDLLSFKISDGFEVLAGKEYELPFTFGLADTGFNTYRGTNVECNYGCKLNIDQDKSLLRDVVNFVVGEPETYFVVNKKGDYQAVEEAEGTFEMTFDKLPIWFLIVFGSMLLVAGLLFFIFKLNSIVIFIPFVLIILIVAGMIFFSKNLELKVLINPVKNGFECYFSNPKQKFIGKNCYYIIVEEADGMEGDKKTKYLKDLYRSDVQKYSETNKVVFNFPDKKGLYSTDYLRANLNWYLIVEGRYISFLPLRLNVKTPIQVIRNSSSGAKV